MKKRESRIALIIGAVIFLSATTVLAADLSADMINKGKGGVVKGTMFMAQNKTRVESQYSITITRMDKKVVWILMPKDNVYMEQAFDPSQAPATSEKVEGEVQRDLIGQEEIDGYKADKFRVLYTDNMEKKSMFQWIVPGIPVPVKMAAVDNSWSIEYKNIKMGKQPDIFFEVPAGYKKFAMTIPSGKNPGR